MYITDPFLVGSILIAIVLMRPTHAQLLQWHYPPVRSKFEGGKRDARSKNACL